MASKEDAAQPEVRTGDKKDEDLVPLDQFLTAVAPGRYCRVKVSPGLGSRRQAIFSFEWPTQLLLNCTSGRPCAGHQVFQFQRDGIGSFEARKPETGVVVFVCRNCQVGRKYFSLLALVADDKQPMAHVTKIGEIPAFGGPLPARLLELADDAADYLKKGHSAESQGLGLGAFAYYRRFVDIQKNRFFDRIIEVAELERAGDDIVNDLKAAKKNHRFKEGMRYVAPAVPPTLHVAGQNPLTLLYGALSHSIHADNDQDCLQLATDIRKVLIDLAESLGHALVDDEELKAAIKRLTQVRGKKAKNQESK